MADPLLVKNDDSDTWGIYYPDRNVIEASIGNDVHEVHGDYLGVSWHEAGGEDLRESIEREIEAVREEAGDLRDRDLSAEQELELDRVESRLESYEKALEIVREVGES